MRTSKSLLVRLGALTVVAVVGFVTFGGCDTGGKEGDRCNPLVLQDECNSGLRCTPATCSEAYCCMTNGSSADPHCHADGCPDTDAGDEGGGDAAEAAAATDSASESGSDAAEAASDADASDSGDN